MLFVVFVWLFTSTHTPTNHASTYFNPDVQHTDAPSQPANSFRTRVPPSTFAGWLFQQPTKDRTTRQRALMPGEEAGQDSTKAKSACGHARQ